MPWDFEPPISEFDPNAVAPPFYDWKLTYPFLRKLIELLPEIQEEVLSKTAANPDSSEWFAWPELSLYKPQEGHSWKVVPFLHTFPGDQPSQSEWIARSCELFPKTSSILREIPGIRTALLSRMGPQTSLTSHTGWAQLSNHVLRCHLPLLVPAEKTCGMICENIIEWHSIGDILVFDDSKIHSAFNNSMEKERIILLFDIARPSSLAKGTAKGSTTEELQGFIDYFK
jgi:Aspartyl/Asparaginyl beta-hydroxylase